MSDSTTDPQPVSSTTLENQSGANGKAIVVGLFGVSGTGKTFTLRQLKDQLGEARFAFYEGSSTIANLVSGGLKAFQKMEKQEKTHWRQRAIDTIGKECAESGRAGVVAGHFIFGVRGRRLDSHCSPTKT